jgi:proteasome lid subunit RPN8/RPN11
MEMIVDKLACLTIMASAIEVFPRECIGLAFGTPNLTLLAIPIQVARRRDESVSTVSELISDTFSNYLGLSRICGYHSHTFKASERETDVTPSKTDMEGIDIGDIEVIVNIRKRRKKREFMKSEDGLIYMSFGGYDLKMAAFERLDGKNRDGPLYKRVSLVLGK